MPQKPTLSGYSAYLIMVLEVEFSDVQEEQGKIAAFRKSIGDRLLKN